MNDPLRRIASQPWKELFLVAFATVIAVSVIDYLLIWLIVNVASVQESVSFLFSSPLQILIPLAVAAGIGVLGVSIAEQFPRYIYLTAGSLWAFVLCLAIALALKGFLSLDGFLVSFSYPAMLGMMVGVFGKGRRFWR